MGSEAWGWSRVARAAGVLIGIALACQRGEPSAPLPSEAEPAVAGSEAPPPAPETPAPRVPAPPEPSASAAPVAGAGGPAPAAREAAPPDAPPSAPEAAPAPSEAEAAPPGAPGDGLDLEALERRLRKTRAIGALTKLALKNDLDDLVAEVRAYHDKGRGDLARLRQRFELLVMKLLSLLQDDDRDLADEIARSRDALWGLLVDPRSFAQLSERK